MTVVGIDDTDARTGGCTTHVGAALAERLSDRAPVQRRLLVRLNPAVPAKTRGNAAVAIHSDASPEVALALARSVVEKTAVGEADPGIVVAPTAPEAVPASVERFTTAALHRILEIDEAARVIETCGYRAVSDGIGRGRIGALAAIGAWAALDDWTTERIAYRIPGRWGTERAVDEEAVFDAVEHAPGPPATWDTVDREAGEVLCAPRTPCPVLFGIRGDDQAAVASLSRRIAESAMAEPIDRWATFRTNQGTDAHLRPGEIGCLAAGRSYRVPAVVADHPETRQGGHVVVPVRAPGSQRFSECVAFEPTKQFRNQVRALRPGDRITACGEVTDGAIKLEKLAVRSLVRTVPAVPTCPACERTMESAGADAGYRCRSCDTTSPGRIPRRIDRDIERGWYEVPPRARRHLARPLARGGFEAPVHTER